jgi:hypothetical protein
MLITFLLGESFNVLIGSFIMRADGIHRLGMVLIMGWAKCVPLGIET